MVNLHVVWIFVFETIKREKSLPIIFLPYIIAGCLSFFYTRIPFISMCWLLGFILSLKKDYSFMLLSTYSFSIILVSLFKNFETIYLLAPIVIYWLNRVNFHSSITSFGNFLGNISYSLYLCHYPIILLTAPIFIVFGEIVSFLIVNSFSIVASIILYFFVDKNRKNIIFFF